jgi:hypothetical protein
MEKTRRKRGELTAYHEAGHAVVAFNVRRRCKRVTIIPEGDNLGALHTHGLPESFHPDAERGTQTRRQVEREAKIGLGGLAAESILAHRRDFRRGHTDCEFVFSLVDSQAGSPDEADAHLNLLWVQTLDLLRHPWNWHGVERLAQALLEKREISWTRAKEIIAQALAEERGRSATTGEAIHGPTV